MIFNSFEFLVFFILFFFLYWFVFNKRVGLQNAFLLVASYVFYAWWDWRMLSLLIGSSLFNFLIGLQLAKTHEPKKRKIWLSAGLIVSVGVLALFKYFNFFLSSLTSLLSIFHLTFHTPLINLILPLGISFYTFRMIGYLLDIDKEKIEPTSDWIAFFCYVAFFPCVVSGPIDRAKAFLPQLQKARTFDYALASDAMRQILWGLFKKMVVADNCATITEQIFNNYHSLPASTLVLGAFLYTIQLYADFSGYSDMALGVARLIGFNITKNFDFPLFSQNIAEFWRKWHISLTTWVTEYIFTPLTIFFRDHGQAGLIAAILINFTIIGIWHGANWTFILFGFLHGCYFIPLVLWGSISKKKKSVGLVPGFNEALKMLFMFVLIMFTFVIFRSDSVTDAFSYYSRLFSASIFSVPALLRLPPTLILLFFILILLLVEWLQKNQAHGLQLDRIKSPAFRLVIYYGIILITLYFGSTNANQFIYFKF